MNFQNSSSRNFSLGLRGAGPSSSNPTSSSGGAGLPSIKYVYELPYLERKEICRIFDENNLWETLGGGLMGYSSSELSEFGRVFLRGASPTDALLTAWASQNHTILELFTLFGRLTHFRAMKVLARFVDPKYHTYIRDPEFHATQELIQLDSPVASPVNPIAPELKVQNTPKNPDPILKNKNNEIDVPLKVESSSTLASLLESVGHLPQIPYAELLSATNNWDRRHILGKGGFGTVYKGVWKNTAVAIKRMEQRANHAYVESQMKQSLGELKCLNSCRHDNILPLYGFSLEGEHPCLVYQYMVNGSLEDRLLCRHKSTPLQWLTRYHIARGVACGIQFLHGIGTKPLIHGDIKSANILLDRNFEAKIGDFGLAREMPVTNEKSYVKVSRVHGTRPYLPDEYLRSKKLSTKVDTYSFGIMLYEIATGQRAYEESRSKKFLRDVIEDAEGNYEPLRDQKAGIENPDVFWHFIKVGRSCTERIAKNRPEMVQVLKAFDLFLSQQNTQASSIRTVSSQVTGIPLLFETQRPASLLLPSTTAQRLSPEMRATSPYWIPQASQVGYQTPPTVSTNQSIANSNPMKHSPNAHQLEHLMMARRSPLPSPAPAGGAYPVPPMMNNNNGFGNGTPGLYNHHQQMINPFQQQQYEPHQPNNMAFNIGGVGGSLLQPYNPPRNPSYEPGVVLPPEGYVNPNPGAAPLAPETPKIQVLHPSPVPSAQLPNQANASGASRDGQPAKPVVSDDFLPVFLLEEQNKEENRKGDPAAEVTTDEEEQSEWTQDGPATVIPLITELGIKDKEGT